MAHKEPSAVKICIAQINPTVGDLVGNLAIMQQEILAAHQEKCNVICFPELCTVGYPPKDLLYQKDIWDAHDILVSKLKHFIATLTDNITVIFGGLHRVHLTYGCTAKYNAAYIIDKYSEQIVHKRLLPCYDVFDENRYFQSGLGEPYLPIKIKVGDTMTLCDVVICEDMWNFMNTDANPMLPSNYTEDPVSNLKGDSTIFILNGSPYWQGKFPVTRKIVENICVKMKRDVVWVNQVGAHDDIITGGYSMFAKFAVNSVNEFYVAPFFSQGRLIYPHSSNLSPLQIKCGKTTIEPLKKYYPKNQEEIDRDAELLDCYCDYAALKLHITEYCRKTGFKGAVIGLSGGIDSALVAALAVDALGAENVTGIAMPSEFSSGHSIIDAKQLADNLGLHDFRIVPIKTIHQSIRDTMLSGGKQSFNSTLVDENIQPRCRMLILMTESNDSGRILLTTGNKSEIAQGYTTLYGDQAGGLAAISDLLKTRVYRLCKFINDCAGFPRIPLNTLTKPPSAELRPDQKDTDTLPPYDLLDPVIELVLDGVPIEIIMKSTTLSKKEVQAIFRRFYGSEFKRQQAAVGAKLSKRSFGSGHRMPIAAKYTTF